MALARHLVERVLRSTGARRVACLWCATDSAYFFLGLPTDVWCGQVRDARAYGGPWPVICHPPCGPWGKFRWKSRESREDGVLAVAHVHRWGGVVEHPVGSSLFREHGRAGAAVERIDQFAWGHLALKPTLLYWWPPAV